VNIQQAKTKLVKGKDNTTKEV